MGLRLVTIIIKMCCALSLLALSACSGTHEVTTTQATNRSLESIVYSVTSGTVRAEEMAELAFGGVGRVQVLHVDLGDEVSKEQVLAEIENEDLLISLENARNDYERAQRLKNKGVFSDTELESALREYQRAQASYQKTIITAPFDGVVVELNLEVGQLSQITAIVPEPLIRIVDKGVRYVRADMDELDLAVLHKGQNVRVKVPAFSDESIEGEIRTIIPYISSVREQERTCEIEVEFDDKKLAETLPVGASADLEVIVDVKEDVLSVPTLAVLGSKDARNVYVVESGALRKKQVVIGLRTFEYVEIIQGLTEHDIVAIPPPGLELYEGMKVTTTRTTT